MKFKPACVVVLLVELGLTGSAFAQQTVTTAGGTQDAIAKFNGSSSVTDSAITETGGNVSVGTAGVAGGSIFAKGTGAGLSFINRTLSLWPPTTYQAGDGFAWYSPDGTARFWTYVSGDLLTVSPSGTLTVGTAASSTGNIFSLGHGAGLSFSNRTLNTWPPAAYHAGDGYAWYNPDGTARLWTYVAGDLLKVTPDGEVDLTAGLRFADGTLQTTATLKGDKGDKGDAGPPVHTSSICTTAPLGSSCAANVCPPGKLVAHTEVTMSQCIISSDTGSCSIGAPTNRLAMCCVCRP